MDTRHGLNHNKTRHNANHVVDLGVVLYSIFLSDPFTANNTDNQNFEYHLIYKFICVIFSFILLAVYRYLTWWRHHIKWKHFPRYWPFVRGIHRLPVNSSHKGQWRGALMFSSICAWMNGWANNREAGDLGRHRVHYDVIVMLTQFGLVTWNSVMDLRQCWLS